MMKKLSTYVLGLATILTAGAVLTGCQEKSNAASKASSSQASSIKVTKNSSYQTKLAATKQTAAAKNKAYYKYPELKMIGNSMTAIYMETPVTFKEMVEESDLTISGVITDLTTIEKKGVIATVLVDKVYQGNQKFENKTIKVRYGSGNVISKDFLKTAKENDYKLTAKEQKTLESSDQVTIAYSENPLLKVGDEIAANLDVDGTLDDPAKQDTTPGGNGTWIFKNGRAGLYFKNNKSNLYERKIGVNPIMSGDDTGTTPVTVQDNKVFNKSMTDLVKNGKLN